MERCKGVSVFCSDDTQWDELLLKMPRNMQDIYFTRGYHKCFERLTGMQAELFAYREDDKLALYPYMKTPIRRDGIKGDFCDIETVYGYGGPLISSNDPGFAEDFEKRFCDYCIESGVIAEFVRFHPLIRNESVFKGHKVLHNRVTVSVDLTEDEDDIWMHQISTGNRNVIRKCIKNGLSVEESDDYGIFYDIYKETMDKVEAEDFYYLDPGFIEDMKNDYHYRLLLCRSDGEVLAAAVFMEYGEYFHYHFAGSRRGALKYSPNNLLLWEAIRLGKSMGHRIMHLGGGLTDSEDDNLFKFKAHFSKHKNDFFIGKKIYREDVYRSLIEEWENKTARKAVKLLQYKDSDI